MCANIDRIYKVDGLIIDDIQRKVTVDGRAVRLFTVFFISIVHRPSLNSPTVFLPRFRSINYLYCIISTLAQLTLDVNLFIYITSYYNADL